MSHIGQKCDRLTQLFSTYEENKTLDRQKQNKMSPFYIEGDRRLIKKPLSDLRKENLRQIAKQADGRKTGSLNPSIVFFEKLG
jgi:hypothetical protein